MGTCTLASQRGGTFLGFIIGLIIGLAIAVAVALFITRAPVPFIDRIGAKGTTPAPATGTLPDPNKSLQGKEAAQPAPADGSASAPGTGVTPPAPAGTSAEGQFSLYNLLPGKPQETTAVPDKSIAKEEAKAADQSKTRYLLQVGAYESEPDADAARAKLALMGYEANISKRERDGKTLHRVRIGPIDTLEDMNRIRTALSQSNMETTVVRIPLTEPTTGKAPAAAR
jgi:cell division protein FtsN